MKKQILSLALALFLGTAVGMAQENRGERPDPSKRIEQMVTDLGLNETQAKEFKAVMETKQRCFGRKTFTRGNGEEA